MIKETIRVRATAEKTTTDVTLTITGRRDLDAAANMFAGIAAQSRERGRDENAVAFDACAEGCRTRKSFKIQLPLQLWRTMKAGLKRE